MGVTGISDDKQINRLCPVRSYLPNSGGLQCRRLGGELLPGGELLNGFFSPFISVRATDDIILLDRMFHSGKSP